MSLNGATLNIRKNCYFVPYNGKIADVTHADTNKHTLNNVSTLLSETRKIVAVLLRCTRVSGTGNFAVYANEGATETGQYLNETTPLILIADSSDRVQYALTVANDDWDISCMGYVIEV